MSEEIHFFSHFTFSVGLLTVSELDRPRSRNERISLTWTMTTMTLPLLHWEGREFPQPHPLWGEEEEQEESRRNEREERCVCVMSERGEGGGRCEGVKW